MARPRKAVTVVRVPEPKRPVPSDEEILGRNLASAYIAMQHGIGMDYAKKRHAHVPVGEFWISVARMVMEHLSQHPSLPPRPPLTIQ